MENMKTLAEVVGDDHITHTVVPALIAQAKDPKWRVRLAIIEFLPMLGTYMKKESFE